MAAAGRPTGTAAEFTVVPAEQAVPLPDEVGFDVGAALGVPALTAHRALTVAEDGPRRLSPGALDGKVVLAAGGAGAVGHAVIQLARWAGATVVTTVSSPEKARLATAAGAHHVVDYREGDPAAEIRGIAPDGVDIVAEVDLGTNLALDLAVLRTRGTISTYANDGGRPVELDVLQNMVLNTRFQFLVLFTAGPEARAAAVQDVTAAVRDGALPVGENHGLPLIRFPSPAPPTRTERSRATRSAKSWWTSPPDAQPRSLPTARQGLRVASTASPVPSRAGATRRREPSESDGS